MRISTNHPANEFSQGQPAETSAGVIRHLPHAQPASPMASKMTVARALTELRNGEIAQRLQAARALGDMAMTTKTNIPEAVVPLCVSLACDADASVRQESAWSLWKLGDDRAHQPLMKSLVNDPDAGVRETVARALGLLGAKDAVPIMLDLLGLERHIPARVRAGIACAFGYLADEKLLDPLLMASKDVEPKVRYEAVRSLGRFLVGFSTPLSERVLALILRYLKPRHESCALIRQAALKALRFCSAKAAMQSVIKVLGADPDAGTREEAACTLVLWDDPSCEQALIEALSDDVWQVRKAAARSLSRFILRYRVYDSAAVCEALRRMERMMPSHSLEWKLAQDAIASLENS